MIESALWWLLLPLAAASGWWIARRGGERVGSMRISDLATSYFRGLNYLLNEQPDKAIEVFLKIAEVDRDIVETHLALGNLFRRRGEVDRAIRFHQNLVSRPGLSEQQRTHALLELGEDYMRAGLLDRAEDLFSELTSIGAHEPSALRHLLAIYQQEKDWDQAITTAKQLEAVSSDTMATEIGQFQCEQAELAHASGDLKSARGHLQKALKTDPKSVRASMLLGRMAIEAGDCEAAIKAFTQIEHQDVDYIPEILDPLEMCFKHSGNEAGFREWLQHIIQRYDGISPVLALASVIEQEEGERAAAAFMSDQLRQRPSVRGLDCLIRLNLSGTAGEVRDNLMILRDLTGMLLQGKPVYRCSNCGFGARSHHWQCPSCKNWKSVKPIHGVAAE